MISIVDYGMGNLRSVQKAFEKLGHAAQIITRPDEVANAERLVLPGVGAFRDAIHELERLELVAPLREYARQDRPLLGICLGLQLMFDVSYEDGEWPGLGIIPGRVIRFTSQPGLKIPHMGWNSLRQLRPSPLLAGIPEDASFYFVHSYYVVPTEESVVVAKTDHGGEFVSVVRHGRVTATQFHPEKSQNAGLRLLANFATNG